MPSFDQFVLNSNNKKTKDEGFEAFSEDIISPFAQVDNEEASKVRLDSMLSPEESSLPNSEDFTDNKNIEPSLEAEAFIPKSQGSDYNFLYGIVRSTEGTAIEDVFVDLLVLHSSKLTTVASVSTNSSGQYLFHRLLNGDYMVQTVKNGYISATSPLITLRGNQILMQNMFMEKEASAATSFLSGIITDEETGTPIENALVALYSISDNNEVLIDYTDTGKDGRYAFPNLQPGNYSVKATFFRREEQNG